MMDATFNISKCAYHIQFMYFIYNILQMYKIYKIVSFYIQIYTNIQVPPMFSLLTYFFFSFSGLVQTVSHKCEWVPKRRERYETRVSGGIEKWDTHIYIIYVCVCMFPFAVYFVHITDNTEKWENLYLSLGVGVYVERRKILSTEKKETVNRRSSYV